MKIKSFFQNLSLSRKIQAVSLFIILLLSTAAFLGTYLVCQQNYSLLYNSIATNLTYSGHEIHSTLRILDSTSFQIIRDSTIQSQLSLIKSNNNPMDQRDAYKRISTTLSNYFQQLEGITPISYISIYTSSQPIHTNFFQAGLLPMDIQAELQQQALDADGSPLWVTEYSNDYGLFLIRDIRRAENLEFDSIGTLVINISPERLVKNATTTLQQTTYYLLADGNHVIYRSSELSNEDIHTLSEKGTSYSIHSFSNGSGFAVRGTIPELGWSYSCVIPYAPIQNTIIQLLLIYVCILIIVAAIAFGVAHLLARTLSYHFNNLVRKMQAFSQNDAEIPCTEYDYSNRTDEIAVLHKHFDQMACQIRKLIEENYKSELLCRDAQLKALQSQISPHFLYNTLESVNWRAKAIGERTISQMVEALGRLLRITLDKHCDTFTLGQELSLAQSYLAIQQIRFEDRLFYNINVDPEWYNARLPRLTIQPLLENAIRCALESNTEACNIEVSVEPFGADLHILVKNTGSSFEADFMELFRSEKIPTRGLGIGLQNIDERLKILFGPSYGISCFNNEDYAVVQLTIPYHPVVKKEGFPC